MMKVTYGCLESDPARVPGLVGEIPAVPPGGAPLMLLTLEASGKSALGLRIAAERGEGRMAFVLPPRGPTRSGLTNDSIAAFRAGRDDGVSLVLERTGARDVLKAVTTETTSKSFGKHYRTVFTLNGERLPARAVELLLATYG